MIDLDAGVDGEVAEIDDEVVGVEEGHDDVLRPVFAEGDARDRIALLDAPLS